MTNQSILKSLYAMEESNKKQLLTKIEQLGDNPSLEAITGIIESFWKESKQVEEYKFWKSYIGIFIAVITVSLCIYTILKMTNNFNLYEYKKFENFDLIAYCSWTILPPIWFLCEYVWLFPKKCKLDSNLLADYKYSQDLASKIWAAFIVLISAILYIKYGKGLG